METAPFSYTYTTPFSMNTLGSAIGGTEAPGVTFEDGLFTEPFVHIAQIEDHLRLLQAFAELKISVEGMDDRIEMPSDKELRWSWFVGLAVERFERWCKALKPSHMDHGLAMILPPLDVLMVWHAYLLNPGWYAEDGYRVDVLKGLQYAGEALTAALGGEFGELVNAEPSELRVETWVQMTATPFDPFLSATQILARDIACPKCLSVVSAPYITQDDTGYLRSNFAITCPRESCSFEVTRETLALRKLASDLAKQITGGNPSELIAQVPPQFAFLKVKLTVGLAEPSIHRPTSRTFPRGQRVKHAMLSAPALRKPATAVSEIAYADFIMQQANYKLDTLRDMLAKNMKGNGGKLIGRIMSAYVDDKMFSMDLVGAVLRQGSFGAKMYNFGWTKPMFFASEEDKVVLQHVIARYHGFLDLMSASPGSFLVPTLDIDLAWHTHQLMASQYSRDTTQFVGRFIDHDDNVAESKLSTSFDQTRRAWKDRFGVEYTPCGCPLSGKTVGQRLAQLVGHGTNPSYLVPPGKLESPQGVLRDPAFLVAVPLHGVDAAEGVEGGAAAVVAHRRLRQGAGRVAVVAAGEAAEEGATLRHWERRRVDLAAAEAVVVDATLRHGQPRLADPAVAEVVAAAVVEDAVEGINE
ncbi:hypothetical protein MSAN_00433300 [Mycena sanguinolenta]|uniref:Uncharacterized protein n=1 Tax=Mycena sanguinolenta TaxID=230812 RepID=A0A8H6ZDS8_9AGAR|nr:hypothetical protein MSAN_00433300 [Mycena sanguinolenta]